MDRAERQAQAIAALGTLALAGNPLAGPQAADCDHVHLPGPEAIDRLTRWRDWGGVVLAAGIRPCAGAIVVLVFALSQGLFSAGIAATFGLEAEVAFKVGVAPTVNHPAEREAAAAAAGAVTRVRRDLLPAMTGEDFSFFLQEVPGAFVWIGNGPAEGGRELHHPNYDFNDAVLPAASGFLAEVAKRSLGVG